jgi:MFS family permease
MLEGNEPMPKLPQDPPPGKESLWTKNFLLIIFMNLFIMLSFQMLMPVLPLYAEKLSGSSQGAGLVVGIFTVSSVFMRPLAGMLADQRGRKAIFLMGLVLFAACVLGYIWVPTLALLLLVRFVHGFAWGTVSTVSSTIATDAIPRTRLGEGMGYVGLLTTLSMAVAPALSLTLAEEAGLQYVFPLSFVAVCLCFLISLFVRYQGPPQTPAPFPGVKGIFETSAIFPGLVVFFITMTYGAIVTFIALYAEERGVTGIGLFFTVYALALLIARPVFGRLCDSKGDAIIVIPGVVGIGLTMGLLYYASSLFLFCVAAFLYGLSFGAAQSGLMAMAVRRAAPQRRGAANATFFVGFDVGIGAGAVIWGWGAEFIGYQPIFALAVIPAVMALGLFLLRRKKTG